MGQATAERAERILKVLVSVYQDLQKLNEMPITMVKPVVTPFGVEPEPVYVNLHMEIDPANPKEGLEQIARRLSVCSKQYQGIGLHPIRTDESCEHTLIRHQNPAV